MKEILLIAHGILILWLIYLVIVVRRAAKETKRILEESKKLEIETKEMLEWLRNES